MTKRHYVTVADELIEHSDAFGDHFEGLGYRVRVEQTEIEYPYTTTFVLTRQQTTMLFEVDSRIVLGKLDELAKYAMSCERDTRVALGLPGSTPLSADDERLIRSMRLGLYRSVPGTIIEVLPPLDLALNIALPDPATLPLRVRSLLGGVFEQFSRSHWREGFESACQVLEDEARKYLISGMKTGRVDFVTPKGKPLQFTKARVQSMTLGQLAGAFASIRVQNHSDSVIGQVLAGINKDRVAFTHFRGRLRTEASLRRHVGRHMYRIIAALKALLNAP